MSMRYVLEYVLPDDDKMRRIEADEDTRIIERTLEDLPNGTWNRVTLVHRSVLFEGRKRG